MGHENTPNKYSALGEEGQILYGGLAMESVVDQLVWEMITPNWFSKEGGICVVN